VPRHLLVYRVVPPEMVVILRVLHDSMDLLRHLPSDLEDFATSDIAALDVSRPPAGSRIFDRELTD
jgi:hypothetical protein